MANHAQQSSLKYDSGQVLRAAVDSATVSPNGRDLAGTDAKGLRIFDLEDLNAKPRVVRCEHLSPYHGGIHWSPHGLTENWIASLCGQDSILWDASKECAAVFLQGHIRTVTDLDWSPSSANQLATCSLDQTTMIWDLRRPQIGDAIVLNLGNDCVEQVKWNHVQPSILATAEGANLVLWDLRKTKHPVRVIKTDDRQAISGLDWSREYKEHVITSSSADKGGIKMWNTEREGDPLDRIIQTGHGIKRVQHTPFGSGIMALSLDGMNLDLYDRRTHKISDRDAYKRPTASFQHLRQPARDFIWRSKGGFSRLSNGRFQDERDFQLISLCGSSSLYLHSTSSEVMARVGWEKGETHEHEPRFFNESAKHFDQSFTYVLRNEYETNDFPQRAMIPDARLENRREFSPKASTKHEALKLSDRLMKEMSFLEDPSLRENNVIAESRVGEKNIVVSVKGPWYEDMTFGLVAVKIVFPLDYPKLGPPAIDLSSPNIELDTLAKLKNKIISIEDNSRANNSTFSDIMLHLLYGRRSTENSVLEDNDKQDHLANSGTLSAPEHSLKMSTKASPMLDEEDEDDPLVGNVAPSGGEGTIVVNDQTRVVKLPSPVHAVFRFGANGRDSRLSFTTRMILLGEGYTGSRNEDFNPKEIRDCLSSFKINTENLAGTQQDSGASPAQIPPVNREAKNHYPLIRWLDRSSHNRRKDGSLNLSGKEQVEQSSDGEENKETSAFTDISKSVLRLFSNAATSSNNFYRILAEGYVLSSDASSAAKQNCELSTKLLRESGNPELDMITRAWHASMIMLGEDALEPVLWNGLDCHAFGKSLLAQATNGSDALKLSKREADLGKSTPLNRLARFKRSKKALLQWLSRLLLSYFEARHDIQTLAMLSCVFQSAESQDVTNIVKEGPKSSHFRRDSVHLQSHDAHSPSATTDRVELRYKNKGLFSEESPATATLMDHHQKEVCHRWRQQYASQLEAWNLPTQRSELLKYNSRGRDAHSEKCHDAYTVNSKALDSLRACGLCQQPLSGLCGSCTQCGSAFHFECFQLLDKAKSGEVQCPEGCGIV